VEREIVEVILTNVNGMSVEIINLGGRIKSIKFPVYGVPTEMVLGYPSKHDYLNDEFYLGATCGRVCNRIAGANFELDGLQIHLTKNDGEHCLHGGTDNLSMRLWKITPESVSKSSVTLSLISLDGDQGFPGTLRLSITYQLSEDNELSIQYTARTDSPTPVNLTNHAYFNLGERDCQSLSLQMMSSAFLESDLSNIPTGKIISVAQTDYNFRESATIGYRQKNTQDESLNTRKGYDHCFILDNAPLDQAKATLTSQQNNISLSVYTDQPAIQLYTGYHLNGAFKAYQGVCLEAQNYTDAENNQHFPSSILKPNQQYKRQIIYKFESF
jgi:aldose 1-epimerase